MEVIKKQIIEQLDLEKAKFTNKEYETLLRKAKDLVT